ncbi:uncharacterized membrane-anchored protein YitT (DUF2179 family) [Sporomusaceae bacterium BoRhaA]|uniref:DUF2905 domain-containing protein n=1 Tax=Pelorhabdus rhamnosifermentans TaxID=2772457 RepID=UPI001C05FAB0|nr:DUF2905 domain-containing protein [Pelorhabdus rhamnosifermentans]MBU2700885.1 uncharacterized membrane-anchored protein YitT (DUF2179 family) [Pelorhabdus rhamnosifermentans]
MISGDLESIGKSLMIFAVVLFVIGAVLVFGSKLLPLGRLPGDIFVQKAQGSFFFPITTCIVISIVLTVLLNLFNRR